MGAPAATVLIVEDDPAIARALASGVRAAGYGARVAHTARDAIAAVAELEPDVVVLDLLLPDGHGIEVCRRVREWTRTPIVVVSALDDDDEKVAALDAGADDYVTKPFSIGELLARLRAALRRGTRQRPADRTLAFGPVEVDLPDRAVRRHGIPIDVTRQEYEVLAALVREPGRVLTHRTLIASAWSDGEGSIASLRFHVAALRRKLEDDPAQPRHLVTETGVGYRLLIDPW